MHGFGSGICLSRYFSLFQYEFLVGGQSLTPPAGPRPGDHKPGEGRTLSSEDFERPSRPIAACAPLANSFHTRNYRLERRASRGRGLSESGANSGLAWHSPLHSDEVSHQASSNSKRTAMKKRPSNRAVSCRECPVAGFMIRLHPMSILQPAPAISRFSDIVTHRSAVDQDADQLLAVGAAVRRLGVARISRADTLHEGDVLRLSAIE
jgi:hypothetical protein